MYGLGILGDKVAAFNIRVIKGYQYLAPQEDVMSKQFYRSGTSIGANCAEAQGAQSPADFLTKLHIALKEANETDHWIESLHIGGFIDQATADSMHNDCQEICKLLTAIIRNTKQNIANRQHSK